MPPSYTAFDKNGCFAATELVGTCQGANDAKGPVMSKGQCCFEVCGGLPVPCGLAFDVVAQIEARSDWRAAIDPRSNAWLEDARMEHASIAAFARLSLELLALGAPPELVAGAHAAALDEIEHARICFALAGEALGPAPLPIPELALADLRDVAVRTAKDSCVGELVSALVLAKAAHGDETIAKMADDELRHAALGWTIVAWACARDPSVLEPVREALRVGHFESAHLDPESMREVLAEARDLVAITSEAAVAAAASSRRSRTTTDPRA